MAVTTFLSVADRTKIVTQWKAAPQWVKDEAWVWYKVWAMLTPHRDLQDLEPIVAGIEADIKLIAPTWTEYAGSGTVEVSGVPELGAVVAVPVLVIFLGASLAAAAATAMGASLRTYIRNRRAQRARELERWRDKLKQDPKWKGKTMGPALAAGLGAAGASIALLLGSPTVSAAAGSLMWLIIAGLGAWLLLTSKKR